MLAIITQGEASLRREISCALYALESLGTLMTSRYFPYSHQRLLLLIIDTLDINVLLPPNTTL
jgi:hypothetical protein